MIIWKLCQPKLKMAKHESFADVAWLFGHPALHHLFGGL